MSALETLETLPPLVPVGLEVLVYRVPLATPVQTSFGTMQDRPACLVRVVDEDGQQGWGEIWCNFPSVGAEHRARLAADCVAPLLLGRQWPGPAEAYQALTNTLHVLSLQTGEPGPIAQVVAGIDIALWDLAARKLGKPLWQLFGGTSPAVRVYASGINPTQPERMAASAAAQGYRAFKLKIGFGEARDTANLRALRAELGANAPLMVDANQAWSLHEAAHMASVLEGHGVDWLEEPVAADTRLEDWKALAARTSIRLAAGENIRGDAEFDAHLANGALRVVQPDIAKWGGFTAGVPLGRRISAHGAWYCPHWLGGGIGLAASLQLKAAVGGAGMVEVDANHNPLRDLFVQPLGTVREGVTTLTTAPGLGVEPDFGAARAYLVMHNRVGKCTPTYSQ
ncbi:MAG: mandelate racemase/muconate lactonizing enzyme family protein [Pseudomonadota bacterium]